MTCWFLITRRLEGKLRDCCHGNEAWFIKKTSQISNLKASMLRSNNPHLSPCSTSCSLSFWEINVIATMSLPSCYGLLSDPSQHLRLAFVVCWNVWSITNVGMLMHKRCYFEGKTQQFSLSFLLKMLKIHQAYISDEERSQEIRLRLSLQTAKPVRNTDNMTVLQHCWTAPGTSLDTPNTELSGVKQTFTPNDLYLSQEWTAAYSKTSHKCI